MKCHSFTKLWFLPPLFRLPETTSNSLFWEGLGSHRAGGGPKKTGSKHSMDLLFSPHLTKSFQYKILEQMVPLSFYSKGRSGAGIWVAGQGTIAHEELQIV